MNVANELQAYKHYNQKTLPLVYDEALSYYESVCQLVAKINEMVEVINNITVNILDDANAYTDNAVKVFDNKIKLSVDEVYQVKKDVLGVKAELDKQYQEFVKLTQAQLLLFDNRLNMVHDRIDETITSVNDRTDVAIKQNNEKLMIDLGKTLAQVKVLNFFTGNYISLQNMFDYICMLQIEDGFEYSHLASKHITYDALAGLNTTYTDLILHGHTIIG